MNEEKLKSAASEAARRMLDTLPEDCAHDFSPRFQRKMRALLRREEHPVLSRSLKSVASIALVIVMLASLLLLSPQVRAAVLFWTTQEEGDGFYREEEYICVEPGNVREGLCYELGWIPEGCWLKLREVWPDSVIHLYVTPEGKQFTFGYCFGDNISGVGSYDMEKQETTVNGMPGTLYIHKWPNPSYTLVWEDTDTGYLLVLDMISNPETIYRIAENVKRIS